MGALACKRCLAAGWWSDVSQGLKKITSSIKTPVQKKNKGRALLEMVAALSMCAANH
jgi:hypothetical protein